MNIRSLSHPMASIEGPNAQEMKTVKAEVSSEDRDADGRRQEQEPDKNPLSDEEMKKAREYLENLNGLKANGLKIEVDQSSDLKVFLVKDQTGQVVRRIVEWELRSLINHKDKKTGQIFDKSA